MKRKNNIFFEEAINVIPFTTFYIVGGNSKDRRRALRLIRKQHREVFPTDITSYLVAHD